jgi:2-phospho-L-lactate transferase/gluconeogenesis factor (CofD/UPF0052 family)
MTRHGETDGYTAADHVAQIARYGGRTPDAVLVHEGEVPRALAERYLAEQAYRVRVDPEGLRAAGVRVVRAADVMSSASLVRHDPERTAAALQALFRDLSEAR